MSRIIYLISTLDKVSKISIGFLLLSIAALFFGGLFYLDNINTLQDVEEKSVKRFLKIVGMCFVIFLAAIVLIPSKEEMYMMALTKDYDKEELYQMSKNEIKDSVDYIFDKVKELKDE